jgi:hypothetical protein
MNIYKFLNRPKGIILFLSKSLCILLVFQICGCKKLVDIDAPVTSTNGEIIYGTDENAASVLTGLYSNLSLSNVGDAGLSSISLYSALSADELSLFSGVTDKRYVAYYTNSLTSTNVGLDFWSTVYPVIFTTNSVIEGVSKSETLSAGVKKQLTGEAKFVRALCYLYLTNLYGDVPLSLSTDHRINAQLTRTAQSEVYKTIINDLQDAQQLLSDKYVKADAVSPYSNGSEERVRPSKWAATALLARVYLFKGDWVSAEAQATTVINNASLYDTVATNKVFLKNNKEAIWQLQSVLPVLNTWEAYMFLLPSSGPNTSNYPFYISPNLVNSFEPGDKRKSSWTDSVVVSGTTYYYPSKYKAGLLAPSTEYNTVLRLGEQYLIRAEARAQQNKIAEAQSDLNLIRKRAGLPNTTAADKNSLIAAILHERQVELFTEWGHRWLDLKRIGNIDAVMSIVAPQKGGTWETTDKLYPISKDELLYAPNLVQNPGY